MKKYFAYLILSCLVLVGCSSKNQDEAPTVEPPKNTAMKGIWVTNVASDAMFSNEKIKETVQLSKKSGITDIFVVVWNKARTMYPSEVMQKEFGKPIAEEFAGRDPLQEMITEAHKEGLKVHAWFEYGFAASNNQKGGMIIEKHPHWAAKDQTGKLLTSSNGFEWMNGLHPEPQAFMLSLIMEVVKKYDVDGIQGDDRLPAMPSAGGYDDYTVELYKKEHSGQTPPKNEKDAAWLTWRANKLTDFLAVIYKTVKAEKPNVIVSMAPSIHPWAKENYLQDWPTWLDKDLCDMVIPQLYRYNIEAYTQVLKDQISFINDTRKRSKFYGGVLIQSGSWNPTVGYLDSMIVANRNNGVKGEVLFFYEGLKKNTEYFQKTYINK